ncbi:trichoplein keratin filament-binding protein-like [Homarus americanus]|uniref:trichoplein keratin filament-binding protein-like n=1 Tax=Homarus americanus TaxID=6706 RepID=UPI001C49509F|nr:trichoplein keratin filament-binding protein-like [Homarus americanus]
MSRRRPMTTGSVRSTSVVGALRVRPGSRPGSAREWFEAYNQRRNEEAWRMEEWKNTVNLHKKREWQAQYYNTIAQPRQKISDEEEWRQKEEKERQLADRRTRLQNLLLEDERKYQEEREQRYKESRGRTLHHHFVYPEVEMLKYRLDGLKKKNQEERKKMSDALSYEVWRKNSPQMRQMESDRFNHFVQEAWVNQRQWKEDERQRRLEEDRKKEIEAAALQQHLEEEEKKAEEEKLKKQAEWKVHLEAQVEQIKERERRDDALRTEEMALERDRLRLHEINQRRERMKELRQRKELELYWARQFQLKLKKKAADIQQELLEDEGIVEDLLRGLPDEDPDEQVKQRRAEAEWMRTVLREQRRLELMREKEYELLFSEEAERLWRKRQAEWEKEQKARDKLMADVIRGLQQQVQVNFSKNISERKLLDLEKNEIQRSIIETREEMEQLEKEEAERRRKHSIITAHSQPSTRMMHEAAILRRDRQEEERKLEEHRREIERIEQQMQQLWGPQYAPPRYGRKRFAW